MARARGTRGIVAYDEGESWCGHCGEKVSEEDTFTDTRNVLRHGYNKAGFWCGRPVRHGKRNKHRGPQ
jgi:hypothetical protein